MDFKQRICDLLFSIRSGVSADMPGRTMDSLTIPASILTARSLGERVRQSLKTRSHPFAERRLADLSRKIDEKHRLESMSGGSVAGITARILSDAVRRFLASHGELDQNRKFHGDLEYSTWRKYRTKLRLLVQFCDREGISDLSDINLDVLEDYHRSRNIRLVTGKSNCRYFGPSSPIARATAG